MSQMGQTEKSAGRNREVRFTPVSRLNSDITACPKSANNGSARLIRSSSSASANGTGGAVMFGGNAFER
jgi:hypothetical protein